MTETKDHFSLELRAAVRDHHIWNGDSHIKIVKYIRDNYGLPMMILTRVKDAQNNDVSCLLWFEVDDRVDHGYRIMEHTHCSMEDEEETIESMKGYWVQ